MSDSPYSVPVPEDLVETIRYHLRDTLGTAVLDLIAKHPSTAARDALVAAARIVNPHATVTDDGIEVAPDDCYFEGVAYPEHEYDIDGCGECHRCGAIYERDPEPDDLPYTIVCRNAAAIGFTSHDFTPDGLGKTCRRCDIARPEDPPPVADDFDIGSRWLDANGVEIRQGATVRQGTRLGGALYANVNVDGAVMGFARTRVLVDFGRESGGGKIIDRVAPDLLVVQTHEL